MKPNDYLSTSGNRYVGPDRRGYTSIPVLPQLWGEPWNEIALAYVHALRPSLVRVVHAEETTDAVCWRVTVYLKGERIESIEQEVEVGLPEDCQHGSALEIALEKQKAG